MGFDDAFPVSLIEPRFKNLTDFAFKKPECLDTLFIQTLKKNQPCNILGGSIYIYITTSQFFAPTFCSALLLV